MFLFYLEVCSSPSVKKKVVRISSLFPAASYLSLSLCLLSVSIMLLVSRTARRGDQRASGQRDRYEQKECRGQRLSGTEMEAICQLVCLLTPSKVPRVSQMLQDNKVGRSDREMTMILGQRGRTVTVQMSQLPKQSMSSRAGPRQVGSPGLTVGMEVQDRNSKRNREIAQGRRLKWCCVYWAA